MSKWTEKIKNDKSFAKKYEGLTLEAIIKQAEKDGYIISKRDLDNVDLKKISGGGTTVSIISKDASISTNANGDHSKVSSKINLNM